MNYTVIIIYQLILKYQYYNFSEKSVKYDYIDEVIGLSRKYYEEKDESVISGEYIVKRIYNLNTIMDSNIEYFSIMHKSNEIISIEEDDYIALSDGFFSQRIKQEILKI